MHLKNDHRIRFNIRRNSYFSVLNLYLKLLLKMQLIYKVIEIINKLYLKI